MSARKRLRVYVDANVAINWVHDESAAVRVIDRIRELGAHLLSSQFLRLEVEPQHGPGVTAERRFKTGVFFNATKQTIAPSTRLVERAIKLRVSHALGSLDALHLAVAELGRADVFITAENPRKPMHHVKLRGTRVLTPRAFLDETR